MFRRSKSDGDNENDDLDLKRLEPNRMFHIAPHNFLSKVVKVFDITDRITMDVGTDGWKDEAKALCRSYKHQPRADRKNNAGTAYLTAKRVPAWYSKNFAIELLDNPGTIEAEWKGGFSSLAKNIITWSAESQHCTHQLVLSVDSFMKFREKFVCDSVTYLWQCNNYWTRHDFSLYKCVGQEKIEVGRYWQSVKFLETAGILALDARELDEIVIIVTCLVVLRKKRQRDDEHHS